MHKSTLLLTGLLLAGTMTQAQTVATFEDISIAPHAYYVNYSESGADVGFNDGEEHYPCVYDTSYGGFWSYGFAYSDMTDSVTSGYTNQYSARAGSGYGGSSNYVVAYGGSNMLYLDDSERGKEIYGFFVTNNTYTANDMRDGSSFSKKFGGATGNDPDWFMLTIRGYYGGVLKSEHVDFYLADFRFADNDSDYIVKNWRWVNLLPLGQVDSLEFDLSSSDTGAFGMNTPAYFCIDDFTSYETYTLSVNSITNGEVKIYPNPVRDALHLELFDNSINTASIVDMSGRVVANYQVDGQNVVINTAALKAGLYILRVQSASKNADYRFIKD